MLNSRVSAQSRRAVLRRANNRCEYCRCPQDFSPDSFSVEHIFPRVKGGDSQLANLALSCQGCNNEKYTSTEAVDPVTEATVFLYHPRQMRWQDHFAWSNDFTQVVGQTPAGRATVRKLNLNRAGIVNLRRVLYAMNEHPPNDEDTAPA